MVGAVSTATPFKPNFALARYNPNGTLDNTFDGDGKLITPFVTAGNRASAVAIQSDGKIVVAGTAEDVGSTTNSIAVARYNINGSLDNTFDADGMLTTKIGSNNDSYGIGVALQNDGKIVVAGGARIGTGLDFALARFNTNGALDNTFDGDGKATLDFGGDDEATAMTLFGTRIYVAGSTNVNGTIDFAVAAFQNDATALPLSLISLTASKQNTTVQLNWKTVDVQNTSAYEIERSTDARSFTKVGAVNAVNSTSEKSYSFTDDLSTVNPQLSTVYYRLKMVDAGKFTYSKVVVVKWGAIAKGLQILMNPVKNLLHLQATGANETAELQISDAAGRIVKQEKVQLNGTTSISIDVQSIAKGNYYLILQTKGKKEVRPFVKQ